MDARQARRHRAELASRRRGTLRLRVPGFLLGMAAVQIKNDDRPGPAERAAGIRRSFLSAQQIRQRQGQTRGAAEAQHLTAMERPRASWLARHHNLIFGDALRLVEIMEVSSKSG